MRINLEKMTTEQRNPQTMNLDEMSPLQIVTEMNREDAGIPAAIQPHLKEIAQVVEWAAQSLSSGGRIFYMGAGTSGRLGVLDASECPPTFGVSADTVVGLIAGGPSAIMKAVEGAEDDQELGAQDLKDRHLTSKDLVIGLAASGRTPYVIGGIEYAKSIGCKTAGITCNEGSVIGKASDCAIDVVVGPEVLTGSTRLKSGTAEKMILNMISTAAMVQIGKSYGNLMVDVVLSNEKLQVRAENIVMQATGVDRETAKRTIAEAGGRCKTAITMILADCGKEEAQQRLAQANGHVRKAILQK